jgi:hypothetical protein
LESNLKNSRRQTILLFSMCQKTCKLNTTTDPLYCISLFLSQLKYLCVQMVTPCFQAKLWWPWVREGREGSRWVRCRSKTRIQISFHQGVSSA